MTMLSFVTQNASAIGIPLVAFFMFLVRGGQELVFDRLSFGPGTPRPGVEVTASQASGVAMETVPLILIGLLAVYRLLALTGTRFTADIESDQGRLPRAIVAGLLVFGIATATVGLLLIPSVATVNRLADGRAVNVVIAGTLAILVLGASMVSCAVVAFLRPKRLNRPCTWWNARYATNDRQPWSLTLAMTVAAVLVASLGAVTMSSVVGVLIRNGYQPGVLGQIFAVNPPCSHLSATGEPPFATGPVMFVAADDSSVSVYAPRVGPTTFRTDTWAVTSIRPDECSR